MGVTRPKVGPGVQHPPPIPSRYSGWTQYSHHQGQCLASRQQGAKAQVLETWVCQGPRVALELLEAPRVGSGWCCLAVGQGLLACQSLGWGAGAIVACGITGGSGLREQRARAFGWHLDSGKQASSVAESQEGHLVPSQLNC